jgi:uncharacterized protein
MAGAETTGIVQLDKLLAGMPPKATLVLVNDPGVESEPFLYQTAHQHLRAGKTVVYAVFNRPPSSVLRGLEEYGFSNPDHRSRLLFLDAYSALMGASENAEYALTIPNEPAKVTELLVRIARERPGAVLVLDSITTMLDHAAPNAFAAAIPDLKKALRQFSVCVAMVTRWPYGPEFQNFIATFDAVVNLKGVEDRVLLNQYFVVERASWLKQIDQKPLLYKTIKPGGVFVYIPKIVITGPYHAGKTTFIQTLSDTAVSVNRLGTTVALDHGHVTFDGLTADLFGTPGQERFDPLLKTIAGQALGVIVVVDSTRPDSLERAREMMLLTGRQGLPVIVAANKQDEAGALSPMEIAKLLHAPEHVRVVGCIGKQRESARAVLGELISQIMLKEATP